MLTVNSLAAAARSSASRQRHWLRHAAIIFGLLLVVTTFGPRLEERFFPVVYDYTIVEHDIADDDGALVFTATYRKWRDCEFKSRAWYGIQANGEIRRALYSRTVYPAGNESRVVTRPIGVNRSLPMRILLPPGSAKIFGEFSYTCPLTPWESLVRVGPFDVWSAENEVMPQP